MEGIFQWTSEYIWAFTFQQVIIPSIKGSADRKGAIVDANAIWIRHCDTQTPKGERRGGNTTPYETVIVHCSLPQVCTHCSLLIANSLPVWKSPWTSNAVKMGLSMNILSLHLPLLDQSAFSNQTNNCPCIYGVRSQS